MKDGLTISVIIVAIIILFCALMLFTGFIPLPQPTSIDSQTLELIQSATSVETFRVKRPIADYSPAGQKKEDKLAPYDYFKVTKIGPIESGDYLKKLQSMMISRHSYYPDPDYEFDSGTILRLKSPKGYVNIALSFQSNGIIVTCHLVKSSYRFPEWSGPIENRSAFLKLVKEAFPNDPEIKAIKD